MAARLGGRLQTGDATSAANRKVTAMMNFTAAVRALRHNPAFTVVAIVVMGVAIGANAAMFSVYDRLVLHPVSMPDPSSLVAIWFNNPKRSTQSPGISVPRYTELQRSVASFSSLGVSAFDSFTLTGGGEATQLNGLRVSASFFPTLRVQPASGRNFTPEEDVPNGPAVCILSHEAWQAQFGGRSMLGQTIQLNGMGWQVIGIMPPRLTAPFGQVQVFAPRIADVSGLTRAQIDAGATYAQAIARLKPGVSLDQARAELVAFSDQYREHHPGALDAGNVTEPRSFVASLVSGFAPTMYTLLGAGACVLLIACANVSSLFVARLLKRRKEVAVRLSIGARRSQIVRQFLSESLLFCSAACALGTLLAVISLRALQSVIASQRPPNTDISLNYRTLLFALGIALAAAVVTGLLPALQASRPDLVEHLKDGMRGSSGGQGGRVRQALIVAEVSLSVVLLVGATLLILTFNKLQDTAPGFEPHGAAAAFVGVTAGRYATVAQQIDFFEQVITSLRAQPGVTHAAVAAALPLSGGAARTTYGVAGQPLPPPGQRPIVTINVVSPGYFSLMGIPLAAGRGFTLEDRASAPKVCLINETFARRLFATRTAAGEVLLFGPTGNNRVEIVGVIRDVKSFGVNVPTPDEVYFPLGQKLGLGGLNVIAKSGGDPNALQGAIARAVASVDKTQAISFFGTLDSNVAANLGPARLVATLTMIFAAIALALALTGLYSVLAFLVSQRTPEIGIRMALGASRQQVVALVMRNGLLVVAIGLALGIGGAAFTAMLIRQLLFGVDPLNAGIYAGVAIAFAAVAVVACLAPSLRASRIDPLIALRAE
jgi:predicted permease